MTSPTRNWPCSSAAVPGAIFLIDTGSTSKKIFLFMLKKCPANYLVCHDRKNEVRAVRKNKQTQLAQMLEFFQRVQKWYIGWKWVNHSIIAFNKRNDRCIIRTLLKINHEVLLPRYTSEYRQIFQDSNLG